MFLKNTNQFFFSTRPLSIFSFLVLLCFAQFSLAADITWTNANGTNNWNDPLNWSTSTVPTAADIAVFDSTSTADSNISSNINIQGIRVEATYTGTVTQLAGFTIIIGTDAILGGGSFVGGNSNITINGNLSNTGTSFSSTTGTLQIDGDYNLNGGTFTHNNGTVLFRGTDKTVSGVQVFNNLTLDYTSNGTLDLNDDITVIGSFILTSNRNIGINGATIHQEGDVIINNGATFGGGSGTIRFNGTGNQSVSSTSAAGRGELPNIIVDKPSGLLTFTGITSLTGNWTHLNGNIDYTTNDATIAFTLGNQEINGAQTFHNVRVAHTSHGNFTLNDPITITGSLTTAGSSNLYIMGAELRLEGSMTITNTAAPNAAGTGTIRFAGNQNQVVTSTVGISRGALPNVFIDKSGGTLTFDGIVSVEGDWTYLTGNVDYTTNDATIGFVYRDQTISGVQTFNNFWVNDCCNGSITMTEDITVSGLFTYSGVSSASIHGNIYAEGDVLISNGSPYNSGSGNFYITGNQNQTITSTVAVARGELPNVIVNKTGGTATFSGIISVTGDWTYLSGNLDYVTNDATIALTNNNQSVYGTQTFHNLQLYRSGHGTTTLIDEITVSNLLILGSLSGPSLLRITEIDGAPLNLLGDMIISNSYTANKGTGLIRISGNSDQTITSRVGLGQGELPHIEIGKSNGTATFIGIVSVSQDWTYLSGNIDYATNDATIAFTDRNQNINGSQAFHNLQFHHADHGAITISDEISVANLFTVSGDNHITSIDGQAINVSGDLLMSNNNIANAGNGLIRIDGASNQTITSVVGLGRGEFPNIEINKSGGTATFSGLFSVYGDWSFVAGNLDYGTNDATIAFTNANQTISGVQDFHNLQFNLISSGSMRVNDEINVANLFTFSGSVHTAIDNQTINVSGDIDISNNISTAGGTGTIRITGGVDQDINSTSPVAMGRLPNVEINKSGGLATITGIISINGNFEYIDGNVDATTNTTRVAIYGPGTIDGEGPSGNMVFHDLGLEFGASRALSGDIEVANTFNLNANRLDLNSNAIYLTDPQPSAFSYSSGRIVGDTPDNESGVHWNIGFDTAPHTIPFANTADVLIPVTIENTDGGDLGKIFVATYPTDATNLPYPTSPDVVINMNNTSGADDSDRAIDRFWQLEKSETTGTARITFTYADAEVSGGVIGQEGLLLAKRFDVATNTWGVTSSNQTASPGANSLTVDGLVQFSPWALFMLNDPDNDGVDSSVDLDDDNDGILDTVEGMLDIDLDLLPNSLDLDSDGDGIPDNVEAQLTTNYITPNADDLATYIANNGVNTAYLGGLSPTNSDNADLPDYLDLDSDNEGANDTSEAVITLSGNDIDADGLDDATDTDTSGYQDPGGTIDDPLFGAIQLPDTDEDATSGGDVDFRDATDDRPDTDNDNLVDAVDLDDDNDGILDTDELNVVISNAQPDCTNETIMDFSTAPVLESGTALQQGAVYRFPNVTAGTDALVTIFRTFNAYVSDIDNNSAEAQAFRPRTGFDISNVGKKGYIEYRMQFVNSGGTSPVVIDKFFMNINDTDGNATYSEEIWVNSPTGYIISTPTELTITHNNPWVIAFGGTTEYPGAGNTFPQVNFGINYISRSEISFRAGITTIVPTVAASGREHNIDFRCTTNYINPITYGLDIDGDGINNNLDTDSDGDGCNDADEAYGNFNTDGDDNGMFGNGTPAVNPDGTVNAASYQVPADGDTNGTPDFLEVGAVPIITTQPLDAVLCEGDNVTFVVASNADSYQWQINTGTVWIDLTDSGIHGGTTTDTLTITNAQLADSGAQYQVVLTNSGYVCGTSTSNPVGLLVSSAPDITIGDASEIEGGNIIFPIILSAISCGNEDIILTLDFSDDTADATDYLSTPVQITIPSGATTAEVIVPTTADSIDEDDETFTISIASVDAGTVNNTNDTAIGTILDDDTSDLDSDDDGILDSIEDLNADGDNDPSTNPTDSDSDTYPDYLDIDSDNDGIPDNVEAQATSGYTAPSLIDANGNGLDDAYENGANIGLTPVNTDGADAPDYLDGDSDNDNIPDSTEGHDQDRNGLPDETLIGSDKDDDGLDDSFEGSQEIDVDVNDEIDDPTSRLPNTDGDGEPDYRDSDDDGDGIETTDEDANNDGDYSNDDIDNDGIPDYLEPNWPDIEVFNVVTPNGDGVHDVLTITGLDIRPNNTLRIFNRWGIVVFTTDGYNDTSNFFDGTSQARTTVGQDKKLPVGTYFYVLDYEDVDAVMKQLSGYIYLN